MKKHNIIIRAPPLNFEVGPGFPLLNFEGSPGVPLLKFRGILGPGSQVLGSQGHGSWSPGPTFPLCHHSDPLIPCPLFAVQKKPPEMFYEKGVRKNFTKLTGKHPHHSLLFNKVAGHFAKFLKNTSFTQHLRTAASDDS